MNIEKYPKMNKIDWLAMSICITIGLIVRLYNINVPIGDFHSWRQADTASVARNFARKDFNLLKPQYDDVSSIQTGLDNPQGLRMVEFPIYNAIFASLYKIYPSYSIETYGRVTSVFFALIIIAILYYLLYKEVGRTASIIGSLTFAILPFSIYFTRVVLPETTALGCVFIAIFALYKWSTEEHNIFKISYFAIGILSFASAILIKPTAIFFGFVLFYIFCKSYRFTLLKKPYFYIFFILAGLPLLWWRKYILQFPEGIPASDWLITSVNTYKGLENIFFKPAFFRWVFYERINNIIFGGYITVFFILGIIFKPKYFLFHAIGFSTLTYLLIFQGGNVQHEYYQTLILPALASFVGIGFDGIQKNIRSFVHPIILIGSLLLVYSAGILFSYYHVKDYYNYSNDLVSIASIVRSFTKPTDKIVTDTMGDTTLLYLIDRKGAPAIFKEVPELKKDGYSYLVTYTTETATRIQKEGFQKIFSTDKFTLIKL
ncbi:MAG: glycosyltransferase family 39 protein [Candidatus Roizmanbacteria bacterium]